MELREKDLPKIGSLMRLLLDRYPNIVTWSEIVRVTEDEADAKRIRAVLLAHGAMKNSKCFEGGFEGIEDVLEYQIQSDYYEQLFNNSVAKAKIEEMEKEGLSLQIDKLKKDKWIAPLALLISAISLVFSILIALGNNAI